MKHAHAPRIASRGPARRLYSNEQWQACRMLPLLKGLLEADFTGIEVLPIDAFPRGNVVIGFEETAEAVKASGVDAIIDGSMSSGGA